MKLRSIIAGALAFVLSTSFALAQTNPGSSPLTGSKGGTNNAFMQFTGPATSIKTYALPNASDTIATIAAAQTLTNKTFDTAGAGNVFKINGNQFSSTSGSGSTLATNTSPTISAPSVTGKLTHNGNATAEPQLDLYTDDTLEQANITATTYGLNGGGVFHGNMARGTRASPTAVQSGDITGGFGSRPYDGASFPASSPGALHFVAAENYDASHHGMYQRFLTTPLASTTRQERMLLLDWGGLWVHSTGTFDPLSTTQTQPFSAAAGGQVLISADNAGAAFAAVGYSGPTSAGFRGGVAGGTPASPSATPANSLISFMGGHGFDGTNWTTGTKALLAFRSRSLWSGTNNEADITLEVTANASTTRVVGARLFSDTGLAVGATSTAAASPGTGAIVADGSIKSIGATAGIGYATGAGGTVTQLTNKATGVSLSKVSGAITMNNAALAAATIVSFVLTNTAIAATDVLILNHISGGTVGSYTLNAQSAAGSATINIRNNTAGSLSEAIVIQFVVIKAVNS